jgi:low affinity Fe/Cu permease
MTVADEERAPLAIQMPSEVSGRVGFFDRFAGAVSHVASRAPFFAFCVFLVGAWLVEGIIRAISGGGLGAFLDDKYQLQINTTTTIITFLMVAVLQNSQSRADQATQHKLNAIADGLADLMSHLSEKHDDNDLRHDIEELQLAVGLEGRESSSSNGSSRQSPARPET